MTSRAVRRLGSTNKLALGLAVGTTVAVGTSAAVGHDLGTAETVGAFAVAGTIAVLNLRGGRRHARPHTEWELPDDTGEAVIAAARARSMAAHPAARTDAA